MSTPISNTATSQAPAQQSIHRSASDNSLDGCSDIQKKECGWCALMAGGLGACIAGCVVKGPSDLTLGLITGGAGVLVCAGIGCIVAMDAAHYSSDPRDQFDMPHPRDLGA